VDNGQIYILASLRDYLKKTYQFLTCTRTNQVSTMYKSPHCNLDYFLEFELPPLLTDRDNRRKGGDVITL